jgi:hypothetical protein
MTAFLAQFNISSTIRRTAKVLVVNFTVVLSMLASSLFFVLIFPGLFDPTNMSNTQVIAGLGLFTLLSCLSATIFHVIVAFQSVELDIQVGKGLFRDSHTSSHDFALFW